MEGALNYLATTDESYGELVGRCKALEYRLKVAKAQAFLEAVGTMAEKEAVALCSVDYRQMLEKFENDVVDKEIIAAKRKRAELTVDVWRSLNANRRQG